MKWSPAWILLGLVLTAVGGAAGREWVEAPASAPPWSGTIDLSCGCLSGEILGYGTSSGWANEIQVTFQMPESIRGGPWLIEYVAFYLSGTETHAITLRANTDLSAAPGEVIASDLAFSPVYASWPPEDWTYVGLSSSSCADDLLRTSGECFTIGLSLLPGDMLGLYPVEPDLRGWAFYEEQWIDDSDATQMIPAVRLGLTDLGCSNAHEATWGAVKDLFK